MLLAPMTTGGEDCRLREPLLRLAPVSSVKGRSSSTGQISRTALEEAVSIPSTGGGGVKRAGMLIKDRPLPVRLLYLVKNSAAGEVRFLRFLPAAEDLVDGKQLHLR